MNRLLLPATAAAETVPPMLPTIPLFTLAGYILAEGGTSKRLVRLFNAWFGWFPGGMAVVAGGRVLADLALPIAGLMSPWPLDRVAAAYSRLKKAYHSLGGALPDPFMALSFLALPVIPALKLTDLGLVDVDRFQVVPLFGAD